MITFKDFINLHDFQDLTILQIRKLMPIFSDGYEAFKNLYYVDDNEMEGEYNGLIIRAKKFINEWLIYDNKGGVLETDIPYGNKVYNYLDYIYYKTKEEYEKEVKEMEATYRILDIFR